MEDRILLPILNSGVFTPFQPQDGATPPPKSRKRKRVEDEDVSSSSEEDQPLQVFPTHTTIYLAK